MIIGSIGTTGQDVHNTPYSNRYADYGYRAGGGLMSGPEVHANIVATLHDRAFITTPMVAFVAAVVRVHGGVTRSCVLPDGAELRVPAGSGAPFRLEGFRGGRVLLGHWRVEMGGMLVLGGITYAVAFAWRWRVLRQVLRAVKSAPIRRHSRWIQGGCVWAGSRERSPCCLRIFVDSRRIPRAIRRPRRSRCSTGITRSSCP